MFDSMAASTITEELDVEEHEAEEGGVAGSFRGAGGVPIRVTWGDGREETVPVTMVQDAVGEAAHAAMKARILAQARAEMASIQIPLPPPSPGIILHGLSRSPSRSPGMLPGGPLFQSTGGTITTSPVMYVYPQVQLGIASSPTTTADFVPALYPSALGLPSPVRVITPALAALATTPGSAGAGPLDPQAAPGVGSGQPTAPATTASAGGPSDAGGPAALGTETGESSARNGKDVVGETGLVLTEAVRAEYAVAGNTAPPEAAPAVALHASAVVVAPAVVPAPIVEAAPTQAVVAAPAPAVAAAPAETGAVKESVDAQADAPIIVALLSYPLKPFPPQPTLPPDDEDVVLLHRSQLEEYARRHAPAVLATLDVAFSKFRATPMKLWDAMERKFPGTTDEFVQVAVQAAAERTAARAKADRYAAELAAYEHVVTRAVTVSGYTAPAVSYLNSAGDVVQRVVGEAPPAGYTLVALSRGVPPLPSLAHALRDLRHLSRHDLALLDYFRKPLPMLGVIFGVLCVLLEQPTTWAAAVEVATDSLLVQKLSSLSMLSPAEVAVSSLSNADVLPFFPGFTLAEGSSQCVVPAPGQAGRWGEGEGEEAAQLSFTARLSRKQVELASKLLHKRADVRAEVRALRLVLPEREGGLPCAVLVALADWEVALVATHS